MIAVDPLALRPPQAWINDREIMAYILQLQNVIVELRDRTGGGDDQVANQQVQELYPWGSGTPDEDEVNFPTIQLANRQPDKFIITTAVDYTTTGSDVIICSGSVTITLNETPDEHEIVTIKRLTPSVVVSPGSKTINDRSTNFPINQQYWSLDFAYSVENDGWYVI